MGPRSSIGTSPEECGSNLPSRNTECRTESIVSVPSSQLAMPISRRVSRPPVLLLEFAGEFWIWLHLVHLGPPRTAKLSPWARRGKTSGSSSEMINVYGQQRDSMRCWRSLSASRQVVVGPRLDAAPADARGTSVQTTGTGFDSPSSVLVSRTRSSLAGVMACARCSCSRP